MLILGVKKVNTTAYHPQTDSLVERFNRTLADMLTKRRGNGDKEWDEILPYALFAYRSTEQVSTGESPFRLLYGRDPQLPTETALNPPIQRELIPFIIHDYHTTMTQRMSEMWAAAQRNVRRAQRRQKHYHDRRAREDKFKVGEHVFVHTPTLKSGPTHKLASPFKGPYRIVTTFDSGVEVVDVGNPRSPPIRVALGRVRRCPGEIRVPGEERIPNSQGMDGDTRGSRQGTDGDTSGCPTWAKRLRPRKHQLGDELN